MIGPARRATRACIRTKEYQRRLVSRDPPGLRELDPAVHADRVVDAGDQRQAEPAYPEHPVGQDLVVVHDVEVAAAAAQRAQRPQRERERLGERGGPHHADLEQVDPVPDLARPRRAERVLVPVQVQARQREKLGARLELRVGRPGVDLDMVPE